MKSKRTPTSDIQEVMLLLINAWRRLNKEAGPADVLQTREFRGVVNCVIELQKGLETGKTLIKEDYFDRTDLLGAYLLYQWVLHYLQGMSLLGELPSVPKRVLDVCSGPAAFSFAALRHGAKEVFAVDRNTKAMELGAEVCGRFGYPLNIRRWDCLKGTLPVEGKFDLIILGYCLEELFPETSKGWNERQNAFIHMLLKKLTPNGNLLVVDSSLFDVNRRILQLRDDLVKSHIPVQAPCVWRGECPALAAKSPCYAQREFEKPYLVKEIQRAAEIKLSSLKMTYLIFKSPDSKWPTLPDRAMYRVISPPVEAYQGERYYLCGTPGKRILSSHLKEHPKESRPFEYLRRGELISFTNALESHHSIEIVKGTEVRVEAPCGKPLPVEES